MSRRADRRRAPAEIEAEIDRGEFDGYRMLGLGWMGDGEEAE